MQNGKPAYYNIGSLSRMTGLTRRTIRYYVQRELIPKPAGGGRGHYYTDDHLKRIETIKKWQAQGVPLEKIKELLGRGEIVREEIVSKPAAFTPPCPIPTAFATKWTKVSIGDCVEVSFRDGTLTEEDQEAIEDFIISRMKK